MQVASPIICQEVLSMLSIVSDMVYEFFFPVVMKWQTKIKGRTSKGM